MLLRGRATSSSAPEITLPRYRNYFNPTIFCLILLSVSRLLLPLLLRLERQVQSNFSGAFTKSIWQQVEGFINNNFGPCSIITYRALILPEGSRVIITMVILLCIFQCWHSYYLCNSEENVNTRLITQALWISSETWQTSFCFKTCFCGNIRGCK